MSETKLRTESDADPQSAATSIPPRGPKPLTAGLVFAAVLTVAVACGFALVGRADASRDDSAPGTTEQAADSTDAGTSEPAKDVPENPFPSDVDVPDGILDGGTGWLNAAGPIRMKDLRGKIVILDFWTYCCINCIHVLPDLKRLEKEFPNELVVIGVHSAKFDNEKETGNIRKAIQRYGIEHPVINDSRMLVWRKFGARSWPTLAVVDPTGKFLGAISGEGHGDRLMEVCKELIAYHDAIGTLDRTPVRFDLEKYKLKPTPLRFPGKVLADEAGGRLFIADTNHNRIVVASLDGKLLDVIGSGTIGWKDGSYTEARFDHPQGMALVGTTLYVADTENHLLREVDLEAKTVKTLAGTGKQDQLRTPGGKLLETALNSPWDLAEIDGRLYIAMAGPHQLWSWKIGEEKLGVFAGTGREDVTNGTLEDSAFAQPSGFATDGEWLYVTDSEGSSIRQVPLDPESEEEVTTLVGTHDLPRGRALFEFGDIDDVGDEARLQHPIGIAWHDGDVYVADAYNHKIKRLTRVVEDGKPTGEWRSDTWLGNGKPGTSLDPAQFAEPHGLSVANGKMYVADTNNSRVLTIDIATKKVTEFNVTGLKPPVVDDTPDDDGADFEAGKPFVGVPEQTIGADGQLAFDVSLAVPEGFKWNDKFPVTYKARAGDDQKLFPADALGKRQRIEVGDEKARIELPLAAETGTATVEIAVTYGYCSEGGGICKVKTSRYRVPVEITADGKRRPITLAEPKEEKPSTSEAPEPESAPDSE